MTNTEITTPVGCLEWCRIIKESYEHLRLFAEYMRVDRVRLNPDASFQVRVRTGCGPDFDIVLCPSEIAYVDGAAFLSYLTSKWVECMPDSVREHCSEALDEWAVQLGKPTRGELLARPPMPVVEDGA
jgi:hypothetical protein